MAEESISPEEIKDFLSWANKNGLFGKWKEGREKEGPEKQSYFADFINDFQDGIVGSWPMKP